MATFLSGVGASVLANVITSDPNDASQNPDQKFAKFMKVDSSAQLKIKEDLVAMDINNMKLGGNMSNLIGDPLTACTKAQTELNNTYITDILRLCELSKEDDEDDRVLIARAARMTIATKDGTSSTLDIPLLSLVQPAQMAIKSCRINFTAEVTNTLDVVDSQKSKNSAEAADSLGIRGIFVGGTTSSAKVSSNSDTTKTVNSIKKNRYEVTVDAEQIENPGMIFLQGILQEAMTASLTRNS